MSQKATATKRTTASSRLKTKKQTNESWLKRIAASKYSLPATFVLIFMSLGVSALYWVSAATTTYSLWSNNAVPKLITTSDASSVELGVKFQAKVAGYVTGVRFYKSAQNTGTHTGNLWDSTGNLLASVKFSNESTNGWQSATFIKPVSVAANVTYVVSYHAPNGSYSMNGNYFSANPHSNKYLTAPVNSASSPNGVRVYSTSDTAFPTQGANGANYWVDVLFANKLVNPKPAPAAPTNVSANPQSTSVTLNWKASVSANPISQYSIYRDGNKLVAVGTALTYTDSTVRPGVTYTYQVQATDSTGVGSALSAALSVAIPSATAGGAGSGGMTTCALPNYPNPGCTGMPANTIITNTINGDYAAMTPGQVIDGWHITGDLNIRAANVIVRNSEIDGTIDNEQDQKINSKTVSVFYGPFTITDTTIGPAGSCITAPGLGESGYTATRVRIQGHDDGFRMSSNNVTVTDSYAHLCWNPPSLAPPDGSHSDGFQNYCRDSYGNSTPCANLVFSHNTIDEHDIAGNSGINAGSTADGSGFSNATVNDNLFWGGGYTMSMTWGSGPKWTVHGNRIVNKGWQYAPVDAEGTCVNQDWAGNSIVTIDSSYKVTSTVSDQPCVN